MGGTVGWLVESQPTVLVEREKIERHPHFPWRVEDTSWRVNSSRGEVSILPLPVEENFLEENFLLKRTSY